MPIKSNSINQGYPLEVPFRRHANAHYYPYGEPWLSVGQFSALYIMQRGRASVRRPKVAALAVGRAVGHCKGRIAVRSYGI